MRDTRLARKVDVDRRRKPPGEWRRLTHLDRPVRVRGLFVSDLNLGAGSARARDFLRFLHALKAETIYLVGDIFDIWHGGIEWTATHDAILSEPARRAAGGTRVVYLPGNHDCVIRDLIIVGATALTSGMFELTDSVTHVAADGRRYLVLHGDQCDARIPKWNALTRWGSKLEPVFRRFDRAGTRLIGRWMNRDLADRCRLAMNDLRQTRLLLAR
jgi:UDP-2,3-diacylglucosamine pyrophosphatase LpxH